MITIFAAFTTNAFNLYCACVDAGVIPDGHKQTASAVGASLPWNSALHRRGSRILCSTGLLQADQQSDVGVHRKHNHRQRNQPAQEIDYRSEFLLKGSSESRHRRLGHRHERADFAASGSRARALTTLVGVGTAICGASAIAATAPAIKTKEEEVGLALACITLFGLLAMSSYPFLFTETVVGVWLKHDPNLFSIWCGSGIHEAAQVIAASGALSSDAIGPAVLVKSIHIFMIGPIILVATYLFSRMAESPAAKVQTKAVLPVYGVIFVVNSVLCALLDVYSPQLLTIGFDWVTVKKVLSGRYFLFCLQHASPESD